jgi:hypothetical protein
MSYLRPTARTLTLPSRACLMAESITSAGVCPLFVVLCRERTISELKE